MDKTTGRSHANKHQDREERLMEMWHDPNHWQEALDEISPADMRRAFREMAKEEQAKKRNEDCPPSKDEDRRTNNDRSAARYSNQSQIDDSARMDRQSSRQDVRIDSSKSSSADRLREEYLEAQQTGSESMIRQHPGYAPQSKFAPAAPNSPAYDSAYNQPKPEFYGLDIGVLRLGVNSNGSLDLGVNVGVAKAGVQLGLENRVDGEFMPIGGPLHARAGAGIGLNRSGIHSEVGAGANFFNVVNGDADFGVSLGREISVDGDVRGRAFPVNVQADAGAAVGADGINAYTGASTDIVGQAGVRAGAHFDLDKYNSGVGAGVGLRAGDQTLDFGPSIQSDGNSTVRPQLHLEPGFARRRTFYPTGDRAVDEQS